MSVVGLDIVARGWEPPGWVRAFYPQGLPPDWRLTYFANEFPAVMVPGGHWLQADESLLRSWSEDVPASFRYYLENPGSESARRGLDPARCVLGAKLAGLVVPEAAVCPAPTGPVLRFRLQGAPGGAPEGGCLPAWRIPGALVGDLRAARVWLDALVGQARDGRGLLLLEGVDVGAEDLRRWWDLLWLLGVA
jgi:hypothetical protein